MKSKKKLLLLGLMLFVMLANGCTYSINNPVKPSFTSSPTATLTPIPISTPFLSPTPTVIPTLPVEDARKKWWDLLATNGGCQLPCLWGITPGMSTYQEAQNILTPLSSMAEVYFDSSYPGGGISPLYAEGEFNFNTPVSYLYEDNGVISHIAFEAFEEEVIKDPRDLSGESWLSRRPIYGLPTFIKRVEYYSLSQLLSEQGIPTSVMIASSGPSINRGGSIDFDITILYPNQGIWAEYTTLTNESDVGSVIKSCPVNAHIKMELYPPGNPDSFYALLDKTDWGITKNSYKPLEEATSMSMEKFYKTFRNPTNKCIETPTKIWPTPESGGG
jgi:hypothetical protein